MAPPTAKRKTEDGLPWPTDTKPVLYAANIGLFGMKKASSRLNQRTGLEEPIDGLYADFGSDGMLRLDPQVDSHCRLIAALDHHINTRRTLTNEPWINDFQLRRAKSDLPRPFAKWDDLEPEVLLERCEEMGFPAALLKQAIAYEEANKDRQELIEGLVNLLDDDSTGEDPFAVPELD